MTRGYRSWFQDLINVWTMPATMLKKNKHDTSVCSCSAYDVELHYIITLHTLHNALRSPSLLLEC
jgi:hypothetical protein